MKILNDINFQKTFLILIFDIIDDFKFSEFSKSKFEKFDLQMMLKIFLLKNADKFSQDNLIDLSYLLA